MTEQYQQTNINQPMSGARVVDQRDIVAGSGPPGQIPLNEDDEFLLASDFDDITPYDLVLPDVREVTGKDIVVKAAIFPPIAIAVRVIPLVGSGQTIDGAASSAILAAGESLVVRADPPDTHVTPAIPSNNWSIIRTGAP